jgi:hypothetical protein
MVSFVIKIEDTALTQLNNTKQRNDNDVAGFAPHAIYNFLLPKQGQTIRALSAIHFEEPHAKYRKHSS